ncbi:MAG: class I SAM-dependent methyltransferase, partial [Thermomicrobia bacterium]|nr:class I SAM-dependent methyltransferase [Thermomicrobia bacterium]
MRWRRSAEYAFIVSASHRPYISANRSSETGSVIGVDMSREMLAVAKGKIQGANVAFVQSSAERLNEVVGAAVDIAVCNSAFWQIRMSEALTALGIVLKAGGRFVFNLPHGFFRFTAEDAPIFPSHSLYQLMLDIATREYGFTLPESSRQRRPLDFAVVKS